MTEFKREEIAETIALFKELIRFGGIFGFQEKGTSRFVTHIWNKMGGLH